ncbi:hypothetical protein FJY63_09235, partial [Candidatus Sumerlaeota bacterium]|nr:hypothetical protein [Candidatus Sumerlaeota bacterium]
MGRVRANFAARVAAVAMAVAMAAACGGPSGPPQPVAKKPTGPLKTLVIPDPRGPAVADLMATVKIAPLATLLPKIESAFSFIPGMTAEAIKAKVGGLLNDPTLSALDQTRPALIAVLQSAGAPSPKVVALLPVTSTAYRDKFKQMGMLVHQKEGGKTLLITQDEGAAVAGQKAFDQLETFMNESPVSDISVFANVDPLAQQLDAISKPMIDMMKATGQGAAGPAFFTAFISSLKEVKDVSVDVSVSKERIEIAGVLRGKPDTSLYKLLDQPSAPDASLLGYLPADSVFLAYSGADPDKMAEFISGKIDQVFGTTTQTAEGIKPRELKSWLDRALRLERASAVAFWVPGSASLLNWIQIRETTDPAAYLKQLEETDRNMQATGIGGLAPTMGKVQLKRDVRKTAGGDSIHKATVEIPIGEMEKMLQQMPAEKVPVMKILSLVFKEISHMEYEVAVVGNYVIEDKGAGKIEAIVDALKAKRPLSTTPLYAQTIFPKEGNLYADGHVGQA